jgi:hypothetical protein
MRSIPRALLTGAIALIAAASSAPAHAQCSPPALEAVLREMETAAVPDCGTKPLRHAFKRARKKAIGVTARVLARCEATGVARIAPAHRALTKALKQVGKASANGVIAPACAVTYEAELEQMDADLTAAANGTATTTTTSPRGTPTTTTQPPCTAIMLEVDKSDCTHVTSVPAGLVDCGDGCNDKIFVVPAVGSLQLMGAPAPGNTSTSFDTDCDDDGTVPLDEASPPDCSLSCDCSSDF